MPDDVKATHSAGTDKEERGESAPMFGMNRRAFESWANSMAKLSNEMAQFMLTRLREEAGMWEKLAACRNAADVIECQSQFVAKTGRDYAESAQKLSRLMLDFASSCHADPLHTPTDTD